MMSPRRKLSWEGSWAEKSNWAWAKQARGGCEGGDGQWALQEPLAGLSPRKPQEEAELGLNPALCPGSDDSHPPTPTCHGPPTAHSLHICSTDPASPQGLSSQPSWEHMASNQGTKSWASAWDFG